jgi:hypothetical protein
MSWGQFLVPSFFWKVLHELIVWGLELHIPSFCIYDSTCSYQKRSTKNYRTMVLTIHIHDNKVNRHKVHMQLNKHIINSTKRILKRVIRK